jgi:RHS repeat-associated protein
MTVEYFLGDHLGSTSLTTDANGAKVSEMRYKPWGEVRSWWTAGLSTTPAYKLADYTFTGQYSHMDDPSTAGVTEGFGLMFYNARLYDPATGRFISADTVVAGDRNTNAQTVQDVANAMFTPLTVNYSETPILMKHNADSAFIQGHGGNLIKVKEEEKKKAKIVGVSLDSQLLDRYSYTLNNPVKYTDPTGYDYYTFTPDQFNYFLALLGTQLVTPLQGQATRNSIIWGSVGSAVGGVAALGCGVGAYLCAVATTALGALLGGLGGYYLGGGFQEINKFTSNALEVVAYANAIGAQSISMNWYGPNGGYVEVEFWVDGDLYRRIKIRDTVWNKITTVLHDNKKGIGYSLQPYPFPSP